MSLAAYHSSMDPRQSALGAIVHDIHEAQGFRQRLSLPVRGGLFTMTGARQKEDRTFMTVRKKRARHDAHRAVFAAVPLLAEYAARCRAEDLEEDLRVLPQEDEEELEALGYM